ncbi:MAG: hypothetical protein QOE59_2761, partial [Actinomycetota bacterium]|nr:hypothetical protein [Actinomycetota bacterium]
MTTVTDPGAPTDLRGDAEATLRRL